MKRNNINYNIHYYFNFLVLAVLTTLFIQVRGSAQASALSILKSKFNNFREHDLQEKLFIHTNKSFYVTGEIIWFKIYDINGAANTPFSFSKVAYVELLNENQMPVLQAEVALGKDGSGGSLFLPFTLHSGNYIFRAYTSWMKNFSPDYYFEKTITIVNTTQDNDFPPTDSLHYEATLFPEGGNLVNGIKSEVGFRVTDQYGNGVDFTGIILNQQHDTIISFKPYKFGMGHFYFTPDYNERYKIVIQIKDGSIITCAMPLVHQNGFVMHVQSIPDNQLKITVNSSTMEEKYCYLIIQTRESIKAAEILFFNNGESSLTINKDILGDGISQLTVFNNRQQPVCERLYFKQPQHVLSIHAETDQTGYPLRHQVILNLQTTDNNKRLIKANMSVSVYKSDSLQTLSKSNILSYLWLSSDLTGRIESPEYYFQGNNDSVVQAVDNLMLTQGWRRFSWRDVVQNKLPLLRYTPELSGPDISGKVTNSQTGILSQGVLTYLSVLGKGARVHAFLSDSSGRIHFGMKDLYGTNQIIVETNTQSKDSINRIEITNPFSDEYSRRPSSQFSITSSLANQLSEHNLWLHVQHAYHANLFNRNMEPSKDTSSFFGMPDKTYLLDNFTRYPTMEEVLREYVQEVAVRIRDKHFHLMVVNNFSKSLYASLFSNDPFVLLDGVPVFDIDKIMAFDPLKVKKLDIITGRYFYGPIIADGILSFHTYKNDMESFPLNPHAVIIDYKGLQQKREFYSPIFPMSSAVNSSIPDFRNALYWSPDITSNSNGKAQCSFYTSDLAEKYLVIVNGITQNGLAGSTVYQFRVTDR